MLKNHSKVDFFEVHPYRCVVINKSGEIANCSYCSNMNLLEITLASMRRALDDLNNSAVLKQIWSRGIWETLEIINREGTENAA